VEYNCPIPERLAKQLSTKSFGINLVDLYLERWDMLAKKIKEYDISGNLITRIFSKGDGYIIYEINYNEAAYYSDNRKISTEFHNIEPIIEKIKLQTDDEKSLIQIAIRSCERALILCAIGKTNEAKQLLEEARKRMAHIKILKGRIIYLLGSMIAIIIDLLITLILSLFSTNTDVLLISKAVLFGGLGGLLSVIINLSKINIDSSALRINNLILGSSRIFIAMICGLFSVILVKSDILLGMIGNISTDYGYLAIAIVGGFSETFIPNLLRNIETKESPEAAVTKRGKKKGKERKATKVTNK
jgi:hypothetical protein